MPIGTELSDVLFVDEKWAKLSCGRLSEIKIEFEWKNVFKDSNSV